MIKPLRKRHLQIWTAWAVLVPIGIISAVLVTPQLRNDKLLQPAATAALPIILKSFNNDNYTINIRSNNDTSQLQLEWINKKTLTYPTATIYQDTKITNNISNATLTGRIEARGTYHFGLRKTNQLNQSRRMSSNGINQSTYHFIVYDFIHHQIIDTVNF
ncbi:MAG TPA: hypothetical protein VN958_19005 [Chitinophagaceae bacterium]|nr:hypothetical protein [Chitinophagaceae bacterium]